MSSASYIRIDSREFEARLSAVLTPFEDYEHRARYGIIETYEPMEIEPLFYRWKINLSVIRKKKELTKKERKMIDDYLAAHSVTECEIDKTSYENIDLYESLILEPFEPDKEDGVN
ncbi:MAG: hypothetical protein PHX44_08220 [Sulfurimonas sp.]|uniref:hypothetical protein n=1 Tax=Sulfurimonas sp. TaxID=2022749 RepID=UPI0026097390|nr:hypothetical protein [Sulfurimonas sp.]MDD2653019.1 hypothetical protein [Sulfurimonas sp.]MDD3452465.1 hypothetical protein [Sulfurimonas sp.]